MLTLRLARAGTKKRPVYHLVAADSRARRDGRFVENLGYYVPARKILVLKQDRIEYWLGQGAATSETARRLIKRNKKLGNQEPQAKPKYEAPAPKKTEPKKAESAPEEKKAEAKPEEKAEAKPEEKKPETEAKAEESKPEETKAEGGEASPEPEASSEEKSE